MVTDEVLQRFAKLLSGRFSGRIFTTEDSIRYTFFYCLSNFGNFHPSDIILEYPHSHIPKAKVDTYILPKNGRHALVFEFKFDRTIPSGRNLPRPQKAGAVFADILRLALFSLDDNGHRYFVYVTDREMAAYFRSKSSQLGDFFDLMPPHVLEVDESYVNRHCETFVKSVGSNIVPCRIACRLSEEFKTGESLRVFEVRPRFLKDPGE